MTRFAGGHFKGDALLFGEGGNIDFFRNTFDAEFGAEFFDEGLVGIGLCAADRVVEMRNGQIKIEPVQNMQQRDGVSPAGNTDDDARAFGNKVFPLNRRSNFFDEVHGCKVTRMDEGGNSAM